MSIDREKLKSIMVVLVLLGFAFLTVTVGCSGVTALFVRASIGGENIDRAQAKAKEIDAQIALELQPGASTIEVENFLTRHEILFTYDRFRNGYGGLVRISEFAAVTIFLQLDSDNRFLRGETHVGLTSL